MIINVIHNPKNYQRGVKLFEEISTQSINPTLKFWPAIYEKQPCTGISQAHKQIVRDAKAKGLNEVWIIEDDLKVPHMDGLQYFIDHKPEVYDLYLGGIYSGSPDKNGLVKSFSGLHCYFVHARFYDTFLSADETKHLDRELSGKGTFIVCSPMVAIQHNGYSENTKKEENYDHYLTNKSILGR